MGSRGRPIFDLNEPPAAEDEESDGVFCFQPQRAVPSSSIHTSDLFATSNSPQTIVNNHAFSHASSVSGFQPFIRTKGAEGPEVRVEQKRASDMSSMVASCKPGNGEDKNAAPQIDSGSADAQAVEKEEGEWSDAEGSTDAYRSGSVLERLITANDKHMREKGVSEVMDHSEPGVAAENVSWNAEGVKDENSNHASSRLDADTNDRKSCSSRNSEGSCKGDISMDGQEDSALVLKQREFKGVEASHMLKLSNNSVKRPKLDQHKEAKLGKKRSRQTMFLNLEDVKQAGTIKTSTPRRQNFPSPITTRTVRETRPLLAPAECAGEKQFQPAIKDAKQVDLSCNEGNSYVESNDPKSECNGDMNSGLLARPRMMNSATELAAEAQLPPISRQSSWKQPTDSRQLKSSQVSTRKPAVLIGQNSMDPKLGIKKLPSKKPSTVSTQYQDTSVERLLREVTNEKFWHHPGPGIAERIPAASYDGRPTVRRACWMEENLCHTEHLYSIVTRCCHNFCLQGPLLLA